MSGTFLEAAPSAGIKGRYRVRIIKAGLSLNGVFYSDRVLREAVRLFEGARVFVKGDQEHLSGSGKDFRNLIGKLSNVSFVAGSGDDAGELQSDLVLIDPTDEVGVKIKEATERGMTDLFGLSIDATGEVRGGSIGGRSARVLSKLMSVKSVDLIVEPGAGGQVLNLIEGRGSQTMSFLSKQTIIDLIKASALPSTVKQQLQKKYSGSEELLEETLREAIADAMSIAAAVSESGHVRLGGMPTIEVGETRQQKVEQWFDAFFDPENKDHRRAGSIKELYISTTGDRGLTGHLSGCDESVMRESLGSASWPQVLGNAITRRLIADYQRPSVYDVWRPVVSVVPVQDFRTNERARYGGYGDLPIVGEGGPYVAQSSPTDEKATYAVQKRGGTEDVTLEMIANDDVGALARIPLKLAFAAKRTLAKFVMDFLRLNPTIYDSLALFHASHNNLGSAALDAAGLAATRLAIMKQTELNSADRIGIAPTWIAVPLDLQETAVNLFNRNTNNDKTFIQALTPTILPVWYWSDTNDWVAGCNPNEVPTIEIGFFRGTEEPELFIQDMPNVGSMFSNDKVTYKIRHIYGGAAVDFRGLYKNVV